MPDRVYRSGPSKSRFEVIYREGQRVSTANFRIFSLSGSDLVGFATSRAIGNRPQRNLIRRRTQAAFREVRDVLPSGLDVIVQVKVDAPQASYASLRSELQHGLEETVRRWEKRSESF